MGSLESDYLASAAFFKPAKPASKISLMAFNNKAMMNKMLYIPYDCKHNNNYARIFTHIFIHADWGHLLFNMLFLYFSGRFFEQYFSRKKLWLTYLFGGIAGGILELLANNLFPALQGTNVVILGASGSIMAIFTALAFYQPNLQVNLFGIFPIRI